MKKMFDFLKKIFGNFDYTQVEKLDLFEGEREILETIRDIVNQRVLGENTVECGVDWWDGHGGTGRHYYGFSVTKPFFDFNDETEMRSITVVFEEVRHYTEPYDVIAYLFKAPVREPYEQGNRYESSPLMPYHNDVWHEDGFLYRREVKGERVIFDQSIYEKYADISKDFKNAVKAFYNILLNDFENERLSKIMKAERIERNQREEKRKEMVEKMKSLGR